MIYIILLASLFGAIGQYLDKYLVNIGISRKDYCYYSCLFVIPFSVLMLFIEYSMNQLKFCFNIVPCILLLLAIFFRYKKQYSIVGCLKHLKPYEDSAYLSLVIIVAFIIDVILRIETLNYISVVSIILTVTGIFVLVNSKFKIKNLQKDLITRILATLIIGYITHYILKYWSIAVYMLFLNLLLTIIFSKGHTIKYSKEHIKIIKWTFIQQIFGFSSLYLSNYLTTNSVTLSSYVKPTTIVIVVLLSFFIKENKPKLKQVFAIVLVVSGILLINY